MHHGRRSSGDSGSLVGDESVEVWQDDRLVEALLAGDETAFDHLSREYFPKVYRFVLRKLGDPETTRDVVQTALGKAMHALESFRGESTLLTWLYACAHNEARMYLRSKGRSKTVDIGDVDEEMLERSVHRRPDEARILGFASEAPEGLALRNERARLVHSALDRLPEKSALALQMKYLEACPVSEIAATLDLTPKAAESLLSRSREAFRREFERLQSAPQPVTPHPRSKPESPSEGALK